MVFLIVLNMLHSIDGIPQHYWTTSLLMVYLTILMVFPALLNILSTDGTQHWWYTSPYWIFSTVLMVSPTLSNILSTDGILHSTDDIPRSTNGIPYSTDCITHSISTAQMFLRVNLFWPQHKSETEWEMPLSCYICKNVFLMNKVRSEKSKINPARLK